MITYLKKDEAYLYPFANESQPLALARNCIIVQGERIVLDFDRVSLSAEEAERLAEALLHAVEVSRKGGK